MFIHRSQCIQQRKLICILEQQKLERIKTKLLAQAYRKVCGRKAYFNLVPILSHPYDINNILEVVYSKPKYLKPYAQRLSAQMTWQTKRQTSQVEAVTQINTTVSLHM